MPFVHGEKAAMCQSLRTPVSWTVVKQKQCFPTLGNYARTCWQLPALASDHSSEPCHRFVPAPTPAPPPQSSPAATWKMALPTLETSPGQLAHHREEECFQASYVLRQSHFALWPQAEQQDMEGFDFMPATWWAPKSHWSQLMWTSQTGSGSGCVADDVPHSNCRSIMNSEQETSKNIP